MNKAVARRVFDEIFNQGSSRSRMRYTPRFVNHGLHRDANLQEDQPVHWENRLFRLENDVDQMVAEAIW